MEAPQYFQKENNHNHIFWEVQYSLTAYKNPSIMGSYDAVLPRS